MEGAVTVAFLNINNSTSFDLTVTVHKTDLYNISLATINRHLVDRTCQKVWQIEKRYERILYHMYNSYQTFTYVVPFFHW